MRKMFQKIPVLLLMFLLLIPAIPAKAEMPEINGSSAITFDMDTKELIYTKDIDRKVYPASITKLLTALVFSEHYSAKKTEYVVYPQEGKLVIPHAIYWNLKNIPVGTEFSADDMMHALLLSSFNDASVVVALNVAENEAAFAELMNKKAQEIGMVNSHFVNASGLHNDDHYTTAYDLMLLLTAAYEDPWIRDVTSKQSYELKTKDQTLGLIENTNKHIGLHGNIMGKTGFTNEAGRCFAGVYEREGRTLGSIILNSNNDGVNLQVFEDILKVTDSAFEEERIIKLSKAEEVGVITVSYKPYFFFGATKEMEVPVKAADTISLYSNDVNLKESELKLTYKEVTAKEVKVDTVVGEASIRERQLEKKVNLLATVNVQSRILKTHLLSYILIVLFTVTTVVLILYFSIRRRRRKMARRRRIEAARKNKRYVDERSKKGFLE